MISSQAADVIGFVGGVIILAAYGWATLRGVAPNVALNALNCLGASLLALSLVVNYNLPALALEVIWAAIALAGMVRKLVTPR
jgi:cell division protein FtsW (lipid II flippase)